MHEIFREKYGMHAVFFYQIGVFTTIILIVRKIINCYIDAWKYFEKKTNHALAQ